MSLVEDVRKQIESRLKELRPLVDEYQQLEKLATGWLEGAKERVGASAGRGRGQTPRARTTRRRTPARRTSSGRTSSGRASTAQASTPQASTGQTGRRRGRPPGSTNRARGRATGARRSGRRAGGTNTRAAQALKLVQDRPGITIPDIAQAMGIKQNYLYRVLPRLEQEGQVARDGRGWKAAGGGRTKSTSGSANSA